MRHTPLSSKSILLFTLLLSSVLQGAGGQTPQVLYITRAGPADGGRQMTSTLCDFYGLTCDTCPPKDASGKLGGPDLLAIILDASSLGAPAWLPEVGPLWRRIRERGVPVLVLGAEPLTVPLGDPQYGRWGPGLRFMPLAGKPASWRTTQGNPRVTRELTDLSGRAGGGSVSPVVTIDPASLNGRLTSLMLMQSADGIHRPTYVQWKTVGGPVFFAAFSRAVPREDCVFGPDAETGLPGALPILTFLRFAGGPRCWNRPTDYANLTIDDPWLTEPYGYLSYSGLVTEMQKARFHTTIAFIPWCYDRSQDDVAALFRDHPEHYSLCVHGNNHDRWEFYRYRTIPGDPNPAKPLAVHEANIRQGLARMERLRELTGLNYDRVMVFPHFIAPLQTLTAIKQHNYLMTVNARNLPLDHPRKEDRLSPLLGVTLRYADFASVRRHTPDLSPARIALELFLDNPVIFYEHHRLFRGGMDAFNGTAAFVNRIQPNTKWAGLGEIARRLYAQRERADGGCDIKAFSPSIDLTNDADRERVYHIEKAEGFDVPIEQVLVDGTPHPHILSDGSLRLAVAVGPQRNCRVEIRYQDDFLPSSADIAKTDLRVNRIRALSDFRDRTLAANPATTTLVRAYYASGLYKLGLKGAAVACFAVAALVATCGWMTLRRVTRA